MEEQHKKGTAGVIFGWLYLTFLIWYLMPPSQRKLLAMKAADRIRTLSQRLAAAHGRYGMARELKDDLDAAAGSYETAYQLMRQVHDRAAKWYEQTRGIIS